VPPIIPNPPSIIAHEVGSDTPVTVLADPMITPSILAVSAVGCAIGRLVRAVDA